MNGQLHRLTSIFLLAFIFIAPACATLAQDEPAAAFEKGESLLQAQRYAQAAEQFDKAVTADPEMGPAWFLLGYSLHMEGKYDEALKAHKRASEFEGEQFQNIAVYNMACVYALTNHPDEALKSLEASIQGGFDDVEKINTDSDLYSLHATSRFAKLIAQLNKDEKLVEQLDAGQKAIDEESYEQAAKIYRGILETDAKNEFATYRLGYALHGAGKLDEAIEFHKKAAGFDGTKAIGLYNWGCALSLKVDKAGALKKLEAAVAAGFKRLEALESDPDLANVREEPEFKELVAKLTPQHSHEAHEMEQVAPAMPYSLGIRMQVMEGESVTIVEVIPGSAAERDGLKADDTIVNVGGKSLGQDPLEILKPYLESGDKIPFEVQRNGETLKIEVKPNKR